MDWQCLLDAAKRLVVDNPPPAPTSFDLEMVATFAIGVVVALVWFWFPPLRWVVDACKLPLFIWFLVVQYNRHGGLSGLIASVLTLIPQLQQH